MIPFNACRPRDLEQPGCPRVIRPVKRVPKARDRGSGCPVLGRNGPGLGLTIISLPDLLDQIRATFHGAYKNRADRKQTRAHTCLNILGCRGVDHAGSDGAGRHAVFHQCDQNSVQDPRFGLAGHPTRHRQIRHLRKTHPPDQLVYE